MRFKSIFWLFNIVVLLAMLVFAFSTFFLLGKEYAPAYWGNIWVIVLLFVVLIAVLDFYFIRNWKLFDLLEKEDWKGLLDWLEDRIFGRGQINRIYTGLLLNTILSTGKLEMLPRLEKELIERKPSFVPRFGVSLGISRLKSGDPDEMLDYFSPLADNPKTVGREWARWCRAMARGEEGAKELMELVGCSDMSVRILAADLLEGRSDESFLSGLKKLQTDLGGKHGERALQRSREENLIAVVLSTNVKEARKRVERIKIG